jgi:hypothetical protein
MRNEQLHALTIVVGSVFLSVASCRHDGGPSPGAGRRQGIQDLPAGGTAAPRPAAPRPAPQHWVQNDQLRAVMGELSLRTRESWPKDLPEDPEASRPWDRGRAFGDAARLAEGLAEAADRIPLSVRDAPMSADDRRGFVAEARRLRESALQLRAAAGGRRLEPMQRSLDQINSACIACHSRYRDFAGELNTRKASAD